MSEEIIEAGKLTRRRLVQAGAGGTALLGLGALGPIEALAAAAGDGPPELRRGTYLPLAGDRFEVKGPAGATLRLASIDDLPSAERIPELRGRDDAFTLRFRGSGAPLESGIHRISHPAMGEFRLFVSPVGEDGEYELLVDRTVEVPGVSSGGAEAGRVARPPVRLLRARLRRARGRRLIATADFDSAEVEVVRASLLRKSRAVSRAIGTPRGTELEIRFNLREPAPAGRYALRLEIRDRLGNESVARRTLRLR